MTRRELTPREKGDFYEALAELYLRKLGWRILGKQVRYRRGELDLVAEELIPGSEPVLVMIEVRSRREGAWVSAEESIRGVKSRRLRQATEQFLFTYRGPAREIRVDLIAFEGSLLRHYRGIELTD